MMRKIIKCPKCNNTLVYIHYTKGFFERGGDIWEISCWWCGYIHEQITHGYLDGNITDEINAQINELKSKVPQYDKIFNTKYEKIHGKWRN